MLCLMMWRNSLTTLDIKKQNQRPFQEPKLEVRTISKAYIRPKFQGISLENMALDGTNVPPF